MIIYPAIDIKDGKVIRLLKGDFDKVTEYSHDPVSMAKQWEEQGAQWLHVVDLDGAKTGEMFNKDIIKQIAQSISIPIEVGGGIRSMAIIDELIEAGVKRVILGTKAIEDREFLKEILAKYPDHIALSLDCNKGYVAQRGWVETSDLKASDFVKELESYGLQRIIHTDIAKDGTLEGPNFDELKLLAQSTPIKFILSGGVASLDDVKKAKTLEEFGVDGVITGRAIYEGTLNLKEALEIC